MENKESKTVRDARGEARRMSRRGGGSYQQCLDAVAKERGHRHWNAYVRSQPDETASTVPSVDAAETTSPITMRSARRMFEPALPYEEWRSGLPTMTRNEIDERRVMAVARRAERISERTGVPLRIVGIAPVLLIAAIHCISMLIAARNLDDVFLALFFLLPAASICFVCNTLGNSRMLGGLRSSMEDFLGLIRVAILAYPVVHISMLLGNDPKVTAYMSRFYGTPTRTLVATLIALAGLQILIVSVRWMLVIATRHPPCAIARNARVGGSGTTEDDMEPA